MKQITQNELIELIKDKQRNAQLDIDRSSQTPKDIMEYVQSAKLTGNIEAYQDLICYINSVEIVPEEKIAPHIKAIVGENYENCFAPNLKVSDKGCVERNDRLREFEFENNAKRIIDAKAVKSIAILEAYNGGFDVYVDTYIMKKSEPYTFCKSLYDDLVEWWKYWKQN